MVTCAEVAAQTGLSQKTLSRWAERGIIPRPTIQTHPSGRGKVGYWPDFVLQKCLRMVQLRQDGHDLEHAQVFVIAEQWAQQITQIDAPLARKLVANQGVQLPDGQKVNLQQVFLAAIIAEIEESLLSKDLHEPLVAQLRSGRHVRQALHLVRMGCNPILTFTGTDVRVNPDFVVGHLCDGPGSRPMFLLPLWPIYHRLLTSMGAEDLIQEPIVGPAPKAWAQDDDTIVEYEFHIGGPNGFHMIRGTTRTVGQTRTRETKHERDKAR